MEALHYPSYSVPAADPEHLGLNPACTTHSYEIWDKSKDFLIFGFQVYKSNKIISSVDSVVVNGNTYMGSSQTHATLVPGASCTHGHLYSHILSYNFKNKITISLPYGIIVMIK